MDVKVLERVLRFCRYIEDNFLAMEELEESEFDEKAQEFVWPQALYRMREGKNMQDVLNGVTPAELLIALRTFEEREKENSDDA